MRYILFIVLIISLLTPSVYAQKYSNAFLDIGVSARSQAMGNTQVASIDDATASFWNPAGLMNIDPDMVQAGFTHSEWFAGISNYDYFGIAAPLSSVLSEDANKDRTHKDAVGFSFVRLGVDNIPNTLSLYEDDGTLNYSNVTQFSAADYAMIFSYARKLSGTGVNVGANAKIVHHKIGPFASAWGFGLDLGAQYKVNDFRVGLMAKDITSTFNAWSFDFTDEEKEVLQLNDNEVPQSSIEITRPSLVLGLAFDKRMPDDGKIPFTDILIEANLVTTFDGERNVLVSASPVSIDPRVGIEFGYNDVIYLRGGLNNIQRATDINDVETLVIQPNVGIGIKLFRTLRIDYALPMGKQALTENSHTISLMLDLNIPRLKEAMRRES